MNTSITASPRGIRFPLVYSRKHRTRLPVGPEHGADGCISSMVAVAIHKRNEATRALARAADAEAAGDHRRAKIERIAAATARRTMRSDALWARVFADQVRDDDDRLEVISRASHAELQRSFRAGIWSARWLRVQCLKFTPGLTEEARRRIDAVLVRIAIAHDALTPWGNTLGHLVK